MFQENKNLLVNPICKSYLKMIAICINASLSAFFVGYTLVVIGSLTLDDFSLVILQGYGFNQLNWDNNDGGFYRSVINGAVPFGAIFGALLSSQVLHHFSRRNGFLATNIPAFLSIIIMVHVKSPYFFIISRLIQGICTGIYSSLVPIYINQIVTPDCSNLGSLNQVFVAFGQFCCYSFTYLLSLFFTQTQYAEVSWKIVGQFPLLTILAQSLILIFIFPYETPKYLHKNRLYKQLQKLMQNLYSQQDCKDALQTYLVYRTESQPKFIDPQLQQSQIKISQHDIKKTGSKRAIFFAFHIAFLQQMSGINVIVVYGKNTLQQAIGKESMGWVNVIIFAISFIASILTIKFLHRWGRKIMVQIGTSVCAACLGTLALAFYLKQNRIYEDSIPQSIVIIIGMWIFMAAFGLTLGPIVWLYFPEIIEPNLIPCVIFINRFGAALCIIAFPLIKTDYSIKYVPFTFFFLWCLASLVVNQVVMIETKNKTRQKIYEEYNYRPQVQKKAVK